MASAGPSLDCACCPRLLSFRNANRALLPDYWNAPVPSFGDLSARLLVAGWRPAFTAPIGRAAPSRATMRAIFSIRPCCRLGLPRAGTDKVATTGCNWWIAAFPTPCAAFLRKTSRSRPKPRLADRFLRRKSRPCHASARSWRWEGSRMTARWPLSDAGAPRSPSPMGRCTPAPGDTVLIDSYHCSRYNTNTGRLTEAMFHGVFDKVRAVLDP